MGVPREHARPVDPERPNMKILTVSTLAALSLVMIACAGETSEESTDQTPAAAAKIETQVTPQRNPIRPGFDSVDAGSR